MSVSIPFDYHMHSAFSCDCRASMADMCAEALRKHIPEIAFTEHFDRVRTGMCFEKYDADGFFRSIQECRTRFGAQGLTVKAGVEVGEIHLNRAEVDEVLSAHPYDLVLGSLHWVRGENIFERPYFQKRDPRTAARDYFAELTEMVDGGGFNIMSHMDVFKRMGFNVYHQFNIVDYEEYVRPVLAACIRRGIAPEINTSALRMPVNQTHPTVEAIRWYREMGGERLSIGSDSHNPAQLGTGLDIAIRIAKDAGFTQLTRFALRQPESFAAI
ncbi:MAG: histidinol-phosphatase HisJ family protein [Aggregatilineales bacterium]